MRLAPTDPRVHTGHDGARYTCRTLASCDTHLRDLTRRIRACTDPLTRLGYEADRDALLDIRTWLTRHH